MAPEPRGQVRVRLLGAHAVADLTGPTACEVITTEEKTAVEARLGPDPIRDDGDVEAFVVAVGRSRVTIGQQLMDQAVVAGVGNIYRAEALFRAGVDPLRPGRDVPAATVRAIWDDLVVLMRDGAARGAIVTTRPEDRGDDRDRGLSCRNQGLDRLYRRRGRLDERPGRTPTPRRMPCPLTRRSTCTTATGCRAGGAGRRCWSRSWRAATSSGAAPARPKPWMSASTKRFGIDLPPDPCRTASSKRTFEVGSPGLRTPRTSPARSASRRQRSRGPARSPAVPHAGAR